MATRIDGGSAQSAETRDVGEICVTGCASRAPRPSVLRIWSLSARAVGDEDKLQAGSVGSVTDGLDREIRVEQ